MSKEPNWEQIRFRKNSEMANLNAMNNACTIVAAWIPEMGKSEVNEDRKFFLEQIEWFRNEIYKLNMIKIDHDAAQNISTEDFDPS